MPARRSRPHKRRSWIDSSGATGATGSGEGDASGVVVQAAASSTSEGSTRAGLETPQGLRESIDVVAVVVGVEGDPEPARSTAADDPGLGSETFRGHPRIVIGVA